MRLLLDEMHTPAVVTYLRQRGHDVGAASQRTDLIGLADAELLTRATDEGRALVTQNVADFVVLHRGVLAGGGRHAGIVLTTPDRFRRSQPGHVGPLGSALAAFVDHHRDEDSFLWWLQPA